MIAGVLALTACLAMQAQGTPSSTAASTTAATHAPTTTATTATTATPATTATSGANVGGANVLDASVTTAAMNANASAVAAAVPATDAGIDVTPPPGALSPDDVVRIALERSGSVRAAYIDAAIEDRERGIELRPLELRLGHRAIDGQLGGAPYADKDGNVFGPLDDTYAAIGWKLPSPAEALEAMVATKAANADRLDVVQVERDFAASVRLLHAQVLSLRAEAELAKSALEIATQLEAQSQQMLAASLATELDARLAGLERLDAATDAEEIHNDAVRAEHELAGFIGLRAPLTLAPAPQKLCRAPTSSVDGLIARARERSESLAEHSLRRERAATIGAWSWTRWLPYVDGVQVGLYNEPLDKRDAVRARVDIALPFFEPFGSAAAVAELERQRADAMYDEEERQIDARVRGARSRLDRAFTLVELHEARSADTVDKSLSEVQRALEAGQADILRVSEVQRRAVRGRRNLIRARLRCEEAAIELLRVTGDVAPDESPAALK